MTQGMPRGPMWASYVMPCAIGTLAKFRAIDRVSAFV